jgi:hypothetical protein
MRSECTLRIFAMALLGSCVSMFLLAGCGRKVAAPAPDKSAAVKAEERFVISADEQTVTDTRTRLVWKRCVEGRRYIMKACLGDTRLVDGDSIDHFVNQEAAPDGWRLPTAKELGTIIEARYPQPEMRLEYHIDYDLFPPPVMEDRMYYRVGGQNGEVSRAVIGWYTYEGQLLGHGFGSDSPAHVRLVKRAS